MPRHRSDTVSGDTEKNLVQDSKKLKFTETESSDASSDFELYESESENEEASNESIELIADELDHALRQSSVLSFTRALSPTKQMLNSIKNNPEYQKEFAESVRPVKLGIEAFEKSVIKIECNSKHFSHTSPWRAATQKKWHGSGFILNYRDNTFIISNAHVVNNYSHLAVRLSDESNWYPAEVELVENDCDLSILSVASEEFMSRVKPLELGELVGMRKSITVLGFPIGGEGLFTEDGTVSRIEVATYCQSGLDFLQMQVSAAINGGNSGGPVVNEKGNVIGVAFQGFDGYQGLGYIIPSPIIKHFLDDYINSKLRNIPYQGFPDLNIRYQRIQSAEYRKALKIANNEIGVRIFQVAPLCSSYNILKPEDILIELDGYPVKDDGTVNTSFAKRIAIDYLISSKHIGDTIDAKVIRNREIVSLTIPMKFRANTTNLIGKIDYEKPPTFYIFCATVFVPVNADIMDPDEVIDDLDDDNDGQEKTFKKFPGQELVMIKEMFECAYTTQQTVCDGDIVCKVNGEKVKNLRHLIHLIESSTSEYVILTTNTKLNCALKRISDEEHKKILSNFVIHSDRSADLLGPPVYKPACPEYDEQIANSQALYNTLTLS